MGNDHGEAGRASETYCPLGCGSYVTFMGCEHICLCPCEDLCIWSHTPQSVCINSHYNFARSYIVVTCSPWSTMSLLDLPFQQATTNIHFLSSYCPWFLVFTSYLRHHINILCLTIDLSLLFVGHK